MSVDIIPPQIIFADIPNVYPSDGNSPFIFRFEHRGHKLTEKHQGIITTDRGTFNVILVKCETCDKSSNPSTIA